MRRSPPFRPRLRIASLPCGHRRSAKQRNGSCKHCEEEAAEFTADMSASLVEDLELDSSLPSHPAR